MTGNTAYEAVALRYDGVRALVLGATGFIGRRVAVALARAGADVVVSGRDDRELDALRGFLDGSAVGIACDLNVPAQLERLVRGQRPDVIFNLAGYGVDRSERAEAAAFQLNAEVPALLVGLLAEAEPAQGRDGQRLVHVGSALEYGTAGGDLAETTQPLPTTLYGRTKLAGTTAVADAARATGLRALTARLFTVYGPGEHEGRLLPMLLDAAAAGTPVDLTRGDQQRDFTFVDDVVEGLLRLGIAPAQPGEVVNLATGRLETVRRFVERAARVIGLDAGLLRFGRVPVRPEEMRHEAVSIARLRTLTGWAPRVSIEEGVARTLQERAAARARSL